MTTPAWEEVEALKKNGHTSAEEMDYLKKIGGCYWDFIDGRLRDKALFDCLRPFWDASLKIRPQQNKKTFPKFALTKIKRL